MISSFPNFYKSVTLAVIFISFFVNAACAQVSDIAVAQLDERFTFSAQRKWAPGYETYYFQLKNNTDKHYRIVYTVTLDLACVGTKRLKLGTEAMLNLPPFHVYDSRKTAQNFQYTSLTDEFKGCRIKDGDSFTLFKSITSQLSNVTTVADATATSAASSNNTSTAPAANRPVNTAGAAVLNAYSQPTRSAASSTGYTAPASGNTALQQQLAAERQTTQNKLAQQRANQLQAAQIRAQAQEANAQQVSETVSNVVNLGTAIFSSLSEDAARKREKAARAEERAAAQKEELLRKYTELLNDVLAKVREDSPISMYNVGSAYMNLEKITEANQWYKRAAEAGFINGYKMAAIAYLSNPRAFTTEEEIAFFRKAAAKGITSPMAVLVAIAYRDNQDVDDKELKLKNLDTAFELAKTAAEKGNALAMQYLALLYNMPGYRSRTDRKQAKYWEDMHQTKYKQWYEAPEITLIPISGEVKITADANEAVKIYNTALTKFDQADTVAANDILNEGLKHFPDHDDLLKLKIHFDVNAGRYQEILPYLLKYLARNPGNKEYYYYAAHSYQQQGDNEAAIVYYKRALSIDSNFVEVNSTLGAIYVNQAVKLYNNTTEQYKTGETAFKNGMQEARERSALGLPYLERALQIEPKKQESLSALRLYYIIQGDDDRAKEVEARMKTL